MIKNLILGFHPLIGRLGMEIINFPSTMSIKKNQTALSKHYWGLKNKGLTPDIQWSILKRSNTPKSFDSRCNLCFEEKIHILLFPEPKILNKRSELIARCRHRAKFKL